MLSAGTSNPTPAKRLTRCPVTRHQVRNLLYILQDQPQQILPIM